MGFPLANTISEVGITTLGIDKGKDFLKKRNINLDLASNFQRSSKNYLRKKVGFFYTTNRNHLVDCDVVVLCLPTPLSKNRTPDPSLLLKEAKKIAKVVKNQSLLILESTVSVGFTRDLFFEIKKQLDNRKVYIDIAFSPERIDPLNKKWDVKNTPKLVAGLTDKARDRAVEFYSKFIDTVIPCSSLEVAETAKLLENSFRLINISFINELAIFCNKMGIDVQEVIKAASTKPYGFMPFYPSVGIGGHCIPVDPVYLSHKAKEVGAPTSFIDLATKVNHEMPKYFVKRASQILGKVKNKKVLVLGVSYKPNISDVRETPVEALIDGLRKKGVKVKWHDDIVQKWRGEKSAEISDKYDLAIIATPHDYFDLRKLGKTKILNTRSSV